VLKTYNEFVSEGVVQRSIDGFRVDGKEVIKDDKTGANYDYADASYEGLRKDLLEEFYEKGETADEKDAINKAVSTYVYALSKNLKIDEDIINMLASAVGVSPDDARKKIAEMTEEFYAKAKNYYGQTS
jgi:hypothetical protein